MIIMSASLPSIYVSSESVTTYDTIVSSRVAFDFKSTLPLHSANKRVSALSRASGSVTVAARRRTTSKERERNEVSGNNNFFFSLFVESSRECTTA